jgi:hypothetical protein
MNFCENEGCAWFMRGVDGQKGVCAKASGVLKLADGGVGSRLG